jgi:S-disulfanyl-L-cysteine oxidoreductase SoxD
MSSTSKALLFGATTLSLASPVLAYDFGRPVTPDEIALLDIDVRPDGNGLPAGGGTVAQGKQVFADNCAVCATATTALGESRIAWPAEKARWPPTLP